MGISAEDDIQHLKEMHPDLRQIAAAAQAQAQALLDEHHPGLAVVRFVEAYRSPQRQDALWRRGRRWDADRNRWVIVGPTVTNARGGESPHNTTLPDGTPAACAADLWIILLRTVSWGGERRGRGELLQDGHPAWSIVPCSAFLVAGDEIRIGASFRSIRGGDWPHIELVDWRDRVRREEVV